MLCPEEEIADGTMTTPQGDLVGKVLRELQSKES